MLGAVLRCSRGGFGARVPPGLQGRDPQRVAITPGLRSRVERLHVLFYQVRLMLIDVPVERLDILRLLTVLHGVAREDDRPEETRVIGQRTENLLKYDDLFVITKVHGRIARPGDAFDR